MQLALTAREHEYLTWRIAMPSEPLAFYARQMRCTRERIRQLDKRLRATVLIGRTERGTHPRRMPLNDVRLALGKPPQSRGKPRR